MVYCGIKTSKRNGEQEDCVTWDKLHILSITRLTQVPLWAYHILGLIFLRGLGKPVKPLWNRLCAGKYFSPNQ